MEVGTIILQEICAAHESVRGPQRRWRSPELAAAYWGGPAATVASGPQGATYAPDRRAGQFPQDRGTEGPQAQVAAPSGSARAPSGGPGWSVAQAAEWLCPAALHANASWASRLWPREWSGADRCCRVVVSRNLSQSGSPQRGALVRHNPRLNRIDNGLLRRHGVWV
jgi:hypothetical protein